MSIPGDHHRVCIMCPGPVFSNLLSIAHTERAGEVRQINVLSLCTQVSNLWWMSNSVSKGFGPATRMGPSNKLQRYLTPSMFSHDLTNTLAGRVLHSSLIEELCAFYVILSTIHTRTDLWAVNYHFWILFGLVYSKDWTKMKMGLLPWATLQSFNWIWSYQ